MGATTMNGKYYESEFEEVFMQLLEQEGWQTAHGEELHRKYTDVLLEDDLREFLKRYAADGMTDTDTETVIANLRNIAGDSDYDTARKTFWLYCNGTDVIPTNGQPFHLDFIDYETPGNNIFRAVNQVTIEQGTENRRPDILLYINGIPVCIIELKNPTDENATIVKAHEQITIRYNRAIPLLMKYCALAVISDDTDSRLGTPYTPLEYFYQWKQVEHEGKIDNNPLHSTETLVKGALAPFRLVELLRDFVYFPDPALNKEREMVCRYPQYFGTMALHKSILRALQSNGGNGKGGTYFGSTGCGKTMTMLYLSRQLLLRSKSDLGSPTILIIVDREDLENQTGELFCLSTQFLQEGEVRVFDSRDDLGTELRARQSGGVYVTTIQKFSEETGLLSDRANIVCMSDEAHRTQINIGSKLTVDETGAHIRKGFAEFLHSALPNATYVGFTGTPLDNTRRIFGDIVAEYTMLQSKDDGITVDIKYEGRLAKVNLDKEETEKIEEYYSQCADEGATKEEILKSKQAMANMRAIIANPDRLERLAKDIVNDYETRLAAEPELLQKAMITCIDREVAFALYKMIIDRRPDWAKARKAIDESVLTKEQLNNLNPVPYIAIVATNGANDPKEMYDALGNKEYRQFLAKEFKSEDSNLHIAIVVDMWITGFDCPSLRYLYNDKPLQKHTLIQTISRVNRKYKTKEYGLIVDYIGIRENMQIAMKQYGGGGKEDKTDLDAAHEALVMALNKIEELLPEIECEQFINGDPKQRLEFLRNTSEYILANSYEPSKEEREKARKEKKKLPPSLLKQFLFQVKILRSAFNICNPPGDILTEQETLRSHCYMGVAGFVAKLTGSPVDVATMNRHVEKMLQEAIECSKVKSIFEEKFRVEDIYSEGFQTEIDSKKLPHTEFELLTKLLKRQIKDYSKTNRTQADKFEEMLQAVIDQYHKRNMRIVQESAGGAVEAIADLVSDRVIDLTAQIKDIFVQLQKDKTDFVKLGITFEEKAFYDILVDIRNKNGFVYPDDKCIELAKKIKNLIDSTSIYADWLNNNAIKNKLQYDLTILLYNEKYPPEWDEQIFQRVLAQVENYKTYNE